MNVHYYFSTDKYSAKMYVPLKNVEMGETVCPCADAFLRCICLVSHVYRCEVLDDPSTA